MGAFYRSRRAIGCLLTLPQKASISEEPMRTAKLLEPRVSCLSHASDFCPKVTSVRMAQVAHVQNRGAPTACRRLHEFVCPDLEADQGIWPECLCDRNVCGIATLGDQDAAYPRDVVARIEGVP